MEETITKRCPSCGEEIMFTKEDEIIECRSCKDILQIDFICGIYYLASLSLDL
jgi:ribosomal protein L37AE/L43A